MGRTEEEYLSYEKALSQCVSFMQTQEDSTLGLLSVLGEYYQSDKAYIYLVEHSSKKFPCMTSWRKNESIVVAQELSSHIDAKLFLTFLDTRSEKGIIHVSKELIDYEENSFAGEWLNAFALECAIISVVENGYKKPLGMVIVSNLRENKSDFRLLQDVTFFLKNDLVQLEKMESLSQLNDRDLLTGMYNRNGYSSHINALRENTPKSLGVVSVNINGLKYVNENLGNSGGDDLICHTATQLKEYFKFDFFRMSGDEFIGLAPNMAKEIFEKKVFTLHTTMKNQNNTDYSLGHAWAGGHYTLSKLLQEAETIMYINKQEYYHTSKREFDEVHDAVLGDLLSYLKNDEFMIYLQPQVRLEDGSLYGAETLIRRFDKTNQKMVFPDEFIPLYEQKSVIRHIDIFVVEEVCKLLSEWNRVGKAIPISVNLSRVTLQEYGIVDCIVEICDYYKVPHHLLVIEVTERVGLVENNVASALITAFKEQGFHISLDDFGCAYSNIVTLAQIEVDEVKIDKSLVDDLMTNKKNHTLVKHVLSMCRDLEGISTLAEGIEEECQGKLLYELGCQLGQGYFYSRPIPVEEFTRMYMDEKAL
ncbi:MAG: GGDEF domain-containing phosphodiesterase [Eubacteriales bacterium]